MKNFEEYFEESSFYPKNSENEFMINDIFDFFQETPKNLEKEKKEISEENEQKKQQEEEEENIKLKIKFEFSTEKTESTEFNGIHFKNYQTAETEQDVAFYRYFISKVRTFHRSTIQNERNIFQIVKTMNDDYKIRLIRGESYCKIITTIQKKEWMNLKKPEREELLKKALKSGIK